MTILERATFATQFNGVESRIDPTKARGAPPPGRRLSHGYLSSQ
jgi:hypothetical protein